MSPLSRFSKSRKTTDSTNGDHVAAKDPNEAQVRLFTPRIFAMALIVSLGGLIFGYDTGQISGFLEMTDFKSRFSENGEFSDSRSGTIVGLLSIGTLCGALFGSPVADGLGRKLAIMVWNVVFIVGMVIQIATVNAWYQVAIGRLVAGFGVGGLSVLTPMYQSETAPRQIRGALVSAYQLFITLGIFLANCTNLGTKSRDDPSSWRITMGVGFIFPAIMIAGMFILPETPRYDYRKGRVDRARRTISESYGVPENHREVEHEIKEIKAKLEAEGVGGEKRPFYEVFTGPRMGYRLALGCALQALQQLTGANFFFYYGTVIFQSTGSTGVGDPFVAAVILSCVNFVMTFPGLYVVEHFGRRKALIVGGLWQFVSFMVFASVGHFVLDQNTPTNTPNAGKVMIVFACLFIVGYAATWGPIIWCVTSELFPTRYRAKAVGMTTASNWTLNFLISFFTPFITSAIDFQYGYVFAACNFLGAVVVYFFLCESNGRSLEEIDTMYILHVPPLKSSSWKPPPDDELVTADKLHLEHGARDIRKTETNEPDQRVETA